MQKMTSRMAARARLAERQNAATAVREARERANIGYLAEFTVRTSQVDEWLADRITKINAEAERQRQRHRVGAGKALHAHPMKAESQLPV